MKQVFLFFLVLFSVFQSNAKASQCPNELIRFFARGLETAINASLPLRYDITVEGYKEAIGYQPKGKLILLNHPAAIDPIIINKVLHDIHPRFVMNEERAKGLSGQLGAMITRAILIPDTWKTVGKAAEEGVSQAVDTVVESLRKGENVVFYPSGKLYRTHLEDVGSSLLLSLVLKKYPQADIVLGRTQGLFGSQFSFAQEGKFPNIGKMALQGVKSSLGNFVVSNPKRKVTITFKKAVEEHFPRESERMVQNQWLNNWFNQEARPSLYVPYSAWNDTRPVVMSNPSYENIVHGDFTQVTEAMQNYVLELVSQATKVKELNQDTKLSDVGVDSLLVARLIFDIESHFKVGRIAIEKIHTVGDLMLAATGQLSESIKKLREVPEAWVKQQEKGLGTPLTIPSGGKVTDLFLAMTKKYPNRIVFVDELLGPVTYRKALQMVMALRPHIKAIEGNNVGLVFPSSVGATIYWLATLFAEKTPVWLNYTLGGMPFSQMLSEASVSQVLIPQSMWLVMQSKGFVLSAEDEKKLVFVESLSKKVTAWQKLHVGLSSLLRWKDLTRAKVSETAAVIFTSGSTGKPKGVPLTHDNILSALRGAVEKLELTLGDSIHVILPPFHSFGIVAGMALPIVSGLPVVYHTTPHEPEVMLQQMASWKNTATVLTATFLLNVIRAAKPGQLDSIRMILTGAEALPRFVIEALHKVAPHILALQGYGASENSGILSFNLPTDNDPDSLGVVLNEFDYIVADVDSIKEKREVVPVPAGSPGLLLVSGAPVFSGYLGGDYDEAGEIPTFIQHNDKKYFIIPDIVKQGEGRRLYFVSRASEAKKIGGEMISAAVVQSVLEKKFSSSTAKKREVVVTFSDDTYHPELVLFTTLPNITLLEANQEITKSGLSATHSIKKIIKIEEIPYLATGKLNKKDLIKHLH